MLPNPYSATFVFPFLMRIGYTVIQSFHNPIQKHQQSQWQRNSSAFLEVREREEKKLTKTFDIHDIRTLSKVIYKIRSVENVQSSETTLLHSHHKTNHNTHITTSIWISWQERENNTITSVLLDRRDFRELRRLELKC
jgi:hypothetical protein